MRFSTLLQAALLSLTAGTALASGATITAALDKVDQKTLALQNTVASWDGGLFGSFHILTKSASLLVAIHAGEETAKQSANLTSTEAIGIASSVSTLATAVNSTMETLIAAHDKFENLLLAPVVLIDLKAQKHVSDEMSKAIIAKVPTELQGIASNLVAPIDAAFNIAIDAFELSKGI